MAGRTPSRRRLAPEVRRREIVEAALEVFARQGYAATELADVAEPAGVGRPLIYHYFPGGKEDLYLAVLDHAWSELLSRFVIEPSEEPRFVAGNLATYLDLTEAGDPAVVVIRQSRQLEGEQIREASRGAGAAFARAMAVNQFGREDPPAPAVSALMAFLAFFEALLEEWTAERISRAQVESLMEAMLPAVVEAAGEAPQGPAG